MSEPKILNVSSAGVCFEVEVEEPQTRARSCSPPKHLSKHEAKIVTQEEIESKLSAAQKRRLAVEQGKVEKAAVEAKLAKAAERRELLDKDLEGNGWLLKLKDMIKLKSYEQSQNNIRDNTVDNRLSNIELRLERLEKKLDKVLSSRED